MRISHAFPGKYLKAADIPEGRDINCTIDTVRMEKMEKNGEEKPVLYFKDKERGLVLNVTNANTLAASLGDETDDWAGRHVILFASMTSFMGDPTLGLRVRVPRQQQAQTPVPLPTKTSNANQLAEQLSGDDDIPF